MCLKSNNKAKMHVLKRQQFELVSFIFVVKHIKLIKDDVVYGFDVCEALL